MARHCGHKGTFQKVFPAANKTRQPCDPDEQGPQRPPELPRVPSGDRYLCILLMKPYDMRAKVKGCRFTAKCTSHSPKTMCISSSLTLKGQRRVFLFFSVNIFINTKLASQVVMRRRRGTHAKNAQ